MRTPLIILIIVLFILTSSVNPAVGAIRESPVYLPTPGVRVHLSPAFNPPVLKGIKVHPDNPFRFDFILDKGDLNFDNGSPITTFGSSRYKGKTFGDDKFLKDESIKLIKYFLASLTVPEKDLWVNLSPYEKDLIIPEAFGQTEMGRDLLAQDYMLKQITASLIYPDDEIGKKFWKRIYEEAAKKFGTTNIPVNTFNKVWIVPEKAVVYENAKAGTAYVVESKLRVMLEEDYLAGKKNNVETQNLASLSKQIIQEIIIPALTKEVNEGKSFAQLRQVYQSLILATWYKKKIKDSILSQVYADKNKVAGVGYVKNMLSPSVFIGDPEYIYQQYLKAFKKGVYNYIKEEQDPVTRQTISRKYFSGGVKFSIGARLDIQPMQRMVSAELDETNNLAMVVELKPSSPVTDKAMSSEIAKEAKEASMDILKDGEFITQIEIARRIGLAMKPFILPENSSEWQDFISNSVIVNKTLSEIYHFVSIGWLNKDIMAIPRLKQLIGRLVSSKKFSDYDHDFVVRHFISDFMNSNVEEGGLLIDELLKINVISKNLDAPQIEALNNMWAGIITGNIDLAKVRTWNVYETLRQMKVNYEKDHMFRGDTFGVIFSVLIINGFIDESLFSNFIVNEVVHTYFTTKENKASELALKALLVLKQRNFSNIDEIIQEFYGFDGSIYLSKRNILRQQGVLNSKVETPPTIEHIIGLIDSRISKFVEISSEINNKNKQQEKYIAADIESQIKENGSNNIPGRNLLEWTKKIVAHLNTIAYPFTEGSSLLGEVIGRSNLPLSESEKEIVLKIANTLMDRLYLRSGELKLLTYCLEHKWLDTKVISSMAVSALLIWGSKPDKETRKAYIKLLKTLFQENVFFTEVEKNEMVKAIVMRLVTIEYVSVPGSTRSMMSSNNNHKLRKLIDFSDANLLGPHDLLFFITALQDHQLYFFSSLLLKEIVDKGYMRPLSLYNQEDLVNFISKMKSIRMVDLWLWHSTLNSFEAFLMMQLYRFPQLAPIIFDLYENVCSLSVKLPDNQLLESARVEVEKLFVFVLEQGIFIEPALFHKLLVQTKYLDVQDTHQSEQRLRILLNYYDRIGDRYSPKTLETMPYSWMCRIKGAIPSEGFFVAVRLAAMAQVFNSEEVVRNLISSFVNQFVGTPIIASTTLQIGQATMVRFGDRNLIELIPKPGNAGQGYIPQFIIQKLFNQDPDDPQSGLGYTSESRHLPILAQLHREHLRFRNNNGITKAVEYQADYTILLHSTSQMSSVLSHSELVEGLQDTLWKTMAQIYNLWARGLVHSSVSRLMHADRNGDNRPWAYYSLESKSQIDGGTMPGVDVIKGMLDWNSNDMFIRDMTKYMGLDSNIRLHLGLVDAEHIMKTQEKVRFWGSIFETIINFVYAGYTNGLTDEEIREIFTPLKMERNGVIQDVFPKHTVDGTNQDPLLTLIKGMRANPNEVSFASFGAIQKLVETYLPYQHQEFPDRIFIDKERSQTIQVIYNREIVTVLSNQKFLLILEKLQPSNRKLQDFPELTAWHLVLPGTQDFKKAVSALDSTVQEQVRRLLPPKTGRGKSGNVDLAMNVDGAMIANNQKGGIDLTPANMNLQSKTNGGEIKVHIDPAILAQMQNATGFMPVIISIQPMSDLKTFLGV